jgi:hypothetical protein
MTSETYPWSFVTQVFHNGRPSYGGDRKTFEVITLTDRCLSFWPLCCLFFDLLLVSSLFEFFDQINMKIFSETAVNLFQTRLGLSLGGLLLKSYPTTQPQTKMANV